MVFNLASVEGESEDGYLGGSNTHLPDSYNQNRSTLGADEDGGMEFGRYSVVSSRSGGIA